MQESSEISKYRALIDTSSVVAHDLCAQLHVLQFCVEELGSYVQPEGKEFLEKMEDSTVCLSRLVDSFRNHLKITLNDEDPTNLGKIYQASLELVKNHFFVILESVEFKVSGSLDGIAVKAEARRLMNILFSLYSMALEEIRESEDLGKKNISIEFSANKENDRFAQLEVLIKGVDVNSTWLVDQLEGSVPEKGRLRKYLGQTSIKEKLVEDRSFLNFSQEGGACIIGLKVPLDPQ